jgi:hypothetical protein
MKRSTERIRTSHAGVLTPSGASRFSVMDRDTALSPLLNMQCPQNRQTKPATRTQSLHFLFPMRIMSCSAPGHEQ